MEPLRFVPEERREQISIHSSISRVAGASPPRKCHGTVPCQTSALSQADARDCDISKRTARTQWCSLGRCLVAPDARLAVGPCLSGCSGRWNQACGRVARKHLRGKGAHPVLPAPSWVRRACSRSGKEIKAECSGIGMDCAQSTAPGHLHASVPPLEVVLSLTCSVSSLGLSPRP